MTSYSGRHADFYDIFYADKPYETEASFIHQCLQQYSSQSPRLLLELACGTGGHALALEKYGYSIIATDYSEDMLSHARRKAKENNSKIDFRLQDMRELNLPEGPFDSVYCLFDSIGYVENNQALEQVFQRVNTHLKPEGLFILEFWHATAMVSQYDPVRVRRWQTHDGELMRISETTLDVFRQLGEVSYTIYEFLVSGACNKFQEVQRNRYFLTQEMDAWLSRFGFSPLKWCAGFNTEEKISASTWHIVVIAKKNEI
jgi:ubiquinone/menaquinone biosynthesis C-methylase UbiE